MDSLQSLFEQFLRERQYLKNVTPKTVIWYETAFKSFRRTVKIDSPAAFGKAALQQFVVASRHRGLSAVSCNTYVKALNAFLGWMLSEGHIPQAVSLPLLRTEKRVVEVLSGGPPRRE